MSYRYNLGEGERVIGSLIYPDSSVVVIESNNMEMSKIRNEKQTRRIIWCPSISFTGEFCETCRQAFLRGLIDYVLINKECSKKMDRIKEFVPYVVNGHA